MIGSKFFILSWIRLKIPWIHVSHIFGFLSCQAEHSHPWYVRQGGRRRQQGGGRWAGWAGVRSLSSHVWNSHPTFSVFGICRKFDVEYRCFRLWKRLNFIKVKLLDFLGICWVPTKLVMGSELTSTLCNCNSVKGSSGHFWPSPPPLRPPSSPQRPPSAKLWEIASSQGKSSSAILKSDLSESHIYSLPLPLMLLACLLFPTFSFSSTDLHFVLYIRSNTNQ